MADFRKCFLALAVLVVMVGAAYADAFQCTAPTGVPARVRGEGRTELVGDYLLNCSGTTGATTITANIQIFLSTNITSRITNTSTNATEALLTLDEPVPASGQPNTQTLSPAAGANVFQGVKAGENSLLWVGIPVVIGGPYPSGTTRTIRITNVRANAAQAGVASGAVIPTQIQMFVSITGSPAVPINNPTQVVAAVLKGLDFALRKCDDSGNIDIVGSPFYQCSSAGTTGATSLQHDLTGLLKFTEVFEVAFKKRIETGQLLTAPANAAPLGSAFSTSESGYVNLVTLAPGGIAYYGGGTTVPLIGGATSGTRLIVRFANIPVGISLFVTTKAVTNGTTAGTTAALISVSDAFGTSGSLEMPVPATGSMKKTGVDYATSNACTNNGEQIIAQVPIDAGGAGSATWEIQTVSGLVTESVAFGYEVAFSARPDLASPAVSTTFGTVTGNFAPVSSDDKMSAYSPIPRFADVPISKNVVNIYECVTNLLFPFVTARASFDTGIVIANTSLDNTTGMPGGTTDWPLATRPQSGKCYLIFFGDKEDGTSLTKPVQVTPAAIPAGKQLVFTVFGGGSGIDAAPGFQGYLIVHCKFQFAHGFAFISDLGAQKLAMGYLALVIKTEYGNPPRRSAREELDN